MKIYKVKHKKTLRKVIALVLIMAITVQCVSQQGAAAKQKMRKTKQKTQESVLDKYGMIAMEKNIQLYCNEAELATNIYAGNDVVCTGTRVNLDGRLDLVGKFYQWCAQFQAKEVNEECQEIDLPDIRSRIEEKSDEWEKQDSYMNVNNETICNGFKKSTSGIQISGTEFVGDCYLLAEETIQYSTNSLNKDGGRIVLYSENGDICINGTDIVINGILAAPNGTVLINANHVTINGRIYAKGVEMSGTYFNINSSDENMSLIEKEREEKEIVKIYNVNSEFSEGTAKGIKIEDDKLFLAEKTAKTSINHGEELKKQTRKYNQHVEDGVRAEVTVHTDCITSETASVEYEIRLDAASSKENVFAQKYDATFSTYKENLYAFINREMLWKDAQAFCEQYGGHLATIGSKEENDILTQLVKENKSFYTAIGFTDEGDEGNWRWVTGEKVDYLNWNPGEPNNSFGRGQDFGFIYSSGKWDDGYRTKRVPFLCEWEKKDKIVPEEGRKIKIVVEICGAVQGGEGWKFIENENGTTTAIYEEENMAAIPGDSLSLFITPKNGEGYEEIIRDSYYSYYDVYGQGHRVSMGDWWLPVDTVTEKGTWSAVYDSCLDGTKWTNVYWKAIQAGDSNIKAHLKAYDSNDGEIYEADVTNGTAITGIQGRYVEISMELERSSDMRSPLVEWVALANDKAPSYQITMQGGKGELQCVSEIYEGRRVSAYQKVSGEYENCAPQTEWSLWKDGKKVELGDWDIVEECPFFLTFIVKKPGNYELQAVSGNGELVVSNRTELKVNPVSRFDSIDTLVEDDEINVIVDLPEYAAPREQIHGKVLLTDGEKLVSIKLYDGKQEIGRSYTQEISAVLPDETGEFILSLEVTLENGRVVTVTQKIILDRTPPEVIISAERDGYEAGETGIFYLGLKDDGVIKNVSVHYDEKEQFYWENERVEIPALTEGTHKLKVCVTDGAGNSTTKDYCFVVAPKATPTPQSTQIPTIDTENVEDPEKPGDDSFPTVAFDSPEGDAVLTEPVDIVGSAYDEKKLDYWQLEYRRTGTEEYVLLAEGTESVKNSVLANFDTTMVPNGQYEMRLTAVDMGGNRSRITRKYVVEGNLKVGAMNLGFTDITAAMGGAKVNVNRTYNSSNKAKGDFGYGWSLGMQGMTLSENTPLSNGYELLVGGSWFAPSYALEQTKNHDIVVDYGDGTSDRFELKISPDRRTILPIHEVELTYRCVTNPKVKLEIDGDCTAIIENTWMLFNDTSMYSKVKYKLTTEDGITIYLSAKDGVTKIIDKYGNRIRVDEDGYHSDDGRSILFTRDNEDRVVSAAHPNGKKTTYTYDSDGNLATFTDAADRTVTFTYDDDHNLISITDPTGAAVARNEYDETGRLIAIIDADGNRTEYDYDIEGRTQVVKDRLGNSTVYVYDENGNILQKTDANGNTTKNTYDKTGNVLTKTDGNGNVTTYTYDESGNINTVTDAAGNSLSSEYNDRNLITSMKCGEDEIIIDYDENYNIESTTDQAGNVTEYDYDKNGNVTGIADSIGEVVKAAYDKDGNVIENTDSTGAKTTYTYDSEGNRLSQTRYVETEEGTVERTTKYVYDEAGDLVQTIDVDGNVTGIERNKVGKMVSTTDTQGRKTSYEYNSNGDVSKVTYNDGTMEKFTYDAEGRVTESINRIGQKVSYKYDKVGNLVVSTDNRGNKTTYKYDSNYNVLSTTSATEAKTTYTYDELNRNTSVTDGDGNTTTFVYDKYSHLLETKDAKENVTKYEYNEDGNRTKTIYPDGSFVESDYDERGRTVWQKDMAGNKTEYEYDSADRLVQVKSETTGTTHYTYDKAGNLAAVTDANGNTVSYEYDSDGRLIKTIQPDGSVSKTTYDKYGKVTESTDYNGLTTTYAYDEEDRIVKETVTSGENVVEAKTTYEYDKYGRVTEISTGESTVTYAYNDQGELSEKSYENGQTISYGYDTYGRKNLMTVSDGDKVMDKTKYDYDTMNRLTRVIAKNGTATVYTYDENGNRKTATFANGVTVTFEYDALNRLLVQKTVNSTGECITKYTYTIGKNGERTKILEEGLAGTTETEYTYDNAGRLIGEEIATIESGKTAQNKASYQYKYDKVGNRISRSVTENGQTVTTSYEYNSRNQLTTETVNGQDTIYSYDANGNLVKKSGVAGNETYKYDVYNRLVKYSLDDGSKSESYTYDAEGVRRSKVTVGGEETKEIFFVSDTSNELSRTVAETDKEGNVVATYSWGDTLLSQTREDITSTYLYDGHGNVRGLLDEKGCLTDTYAYNAYGELTQRTGETENHYLYTGEYYDGMTNLYYLRARYMNPSTGTFISMDTYQGDMYEPVTLHKYLYANANPVKYSDPSGMFSLAESATANAISSVLYENRYQIMGMAIMNGIGKAAMTTLAGGSLSDVTKSLIEGMLQGAATGMFFCAIAAITVTSFAAVFSAVMAADSILSIVLAIRSVMDGDYLNALIYGAYAVVGIIGVCKWYNISSRVDIVGENGSISVIARQDTSDYIETPYGHAYQNISRQALNAKVYVETGGDLYRGGTLGRSNTTNAQFWATENPLTLGYADKYGVDFSKLDYIIKGKLKSGSSFVTRPAPGLGNNSGGGIEIVTPPGSVEFDYFYMIGGK